MTRTRKWVRILDLALLVGFGLFVAAWYFRGLRHGFWSCLGRCGYSWLGVPVAIIRAAGIIFCTILTRHGEDEA
jgi:hypothetical protein